MSRVRDALERFLLAQSPGRGEEPLRLVSSVGPPAEPGEVDTAWRARRIPEDLTDLRSASRTARLFEDADYGQWGLVLQNPSASRRRTEAEKIARPNEFREDDVVIGEFIGDQELLVIAPSESGVRRILIALPLDARNEWFGVADDLVGFLTAYFLAAGQKYWEFHNE